MKSTIHRLRPISTAWCLPAALLLGLGLLLADDANAQRRKRANDRKESRQTEPEEPAKEAAAGEEQSLVDSLELFVYPADEQSPEQQAKDEGECATWAENEVSSMSANSTDSATDTDTGGGRQRSGGALKGAAKGAIVGEALDDNNPDISQRDLEKAGDDLRDGDSRNEVRHDLKKEANDDHSGAETGAVVGAVAGRRRQKKKQQGAEEQAENSAELAAATELDSDLQSALKVCLEARGYRVE